MNKLFNDKWYEKMVMELMVWWAEN